jgi:hypothetical protein
MIFPLLKAILKAYLGRAPYNSSANKSIRPHSGQLNKKNGGDIRGVSTHKKNPKKKNTDRFILPQCFS